MDWGLEDITDTQIDSLFDILEPQAPVKVLARPTRPTRTILPSSVCRSPFQISDKRPGVYRFDRFMKSKEQWRNVGLKHLVDQSFFEDIVTLESELFEDHLDAYISILASSPSWANLGAIKPRVGLTCCSFMSDVEYVFDSMHNNDQSRTIPYNFDDFDPTIEESIDMKLMTRLLDFATGTYPEWGVKPWLNCDKVLAICFFDEKWATLKINFMEQKLKLYDPMSYKFGEADKRVRQNVFLPMARVIPQMLKEIGYFDKNKVKNPQYAQWELTFANDEGRRGCDEISENDCSLHCLKYIENCISKTKGNKGLRNKDEIAKYRRHVASCIYGHSTDQSTIPITSSQLALVPIG